MAERRGLQFTPINADSRDLRNGRQGGSRRPDNEPNGQSSPSVSFVQSCMETDQRESLFAPPNRSTSNSSRPLIPPPQLIRSHRGTSDRDAPPFDLDRFPPGMPRNHLPPQAGVHPHMLPPMRLPPIYTGNQDAPRALWDRKQMEEGGGVGVIGQSVSYPPEAWNAGGSESRANLFGITSFPGQRPEMMSPSPQSGGSNGPRIADLIHRPPSPDSETSGTAGSHAYNYAYIWRRSPMTLTQIRDPLRPSPLMLFTPAIPAPRGARAQPNNPFERLGECLQHLGGAVEHAYYDSTGEDTFGSIHMDHCYVASAIVMVMCETRRAGAGSWSKQKRFAEVLLRVMNERMGIPKVLVRIGRRTVNRTVEGFDIEIIAERYTESEMEKIAEVMFRG